MIGGEEEWLDCSVSSVLVSRVIWRSYAGLGPAADMDLRECGLPEFLEEAGDGRQQWSAASYA